METFIQLVVLVVAIVMVIRQALLLTKYSQQISLGHGIQLTPSFHAHIVLTATACAAAFQFLR